MTMQVEGLKTDGVQPRRGPGRPRLAGIERRAFDGAIAVFGDRGWHAFTLGGVCDTVALGKGTVLLRWPDKHRLLAAAFDDLLERYPEPDTDGLPIRDALIAQALARGNFCIDHGPVVAQLLAAIAARSPGLGDIASSPVAVGMGALKARVEQAVQEGELPEATRAVPLLEAIEGAVYFQTLYIPAHQSREERRAALPGYVEVLVDTLIKGLSAS